MSYGTIKVDTITFTDDGSDVSVSVSGLAKNPTFSGDLTVTGTISGTVIQGGTTVSGVTVTGTTANFVSGVYTTQISGATITGDAGQFTTLTGGTAGFTTVTGTTVTGTTANFVSGVFTTQVSGATITGDAGEFTTLTGGTAGFTTVTGITVTGTTANFVTVSGTTVTGNAGNFTTATVTSGVFASGTAAAPSVSVGATDNGLYSPGADQVAISTNGAQALYIDSDGDILVADGNRMEIDEIRARDGAGLKLFDDAGAGIFIEDGGNVGIGTTSPAENLQVQSASNTTIRIDNEDDSTAQLYFHNTGSTDMDISVSSANMTFSHGASERVRIDSSGRLLVGTSSSINVGANVPAIQQIRYSSSNVGLSITRDGNAPSIVLARTASAPYGLVSVGDPLGSLRWAAGDDTDIESVAALIKAEVDGTPGADDMPGRLVFSTTADGASSPTERMRIANGGNVSIGDPANYAFEILPYSSGGGHSVYWNRASTASLTTAAIFRNAGTTVGSITYNNTATAFNTSSDYRLKENVVPLTGATERVNQLQVHRFNFIADPDTTVDGFIAHEAQAVVPESVTGTKDEVDDEGNPVYQGIDQSKIVPLVVAALQEALAEIETLKTRLADAGIS